MVWAQLKEKILKKKKMRIRTNQKMLLNLRRVTMFAKFVIPYIEGGKTPEIDYDQLK